MNSKDIRNQFSDWRQMMTGTWSKHGIVLKYGEHEKDFIEIGLYREPNESEYAGTYTLQGFNGDEVLFAVTVQ